MAYTVFGGSAVIGAYSILSIFQNKGKMFWKKELYRKNSEIEILKKWVYEDWGYEIRLTKNIGKFYTF